MIPLFTGKVVVIGWTRASIRPVSLALNYASRCAGTEADCGEVGLMPFNASEVVDRLRSVKEEL